MIDGPGAVGAGLRRGGRVQRDVPRRGRENPVALAKDLRAAGAQAGLAIDRDTPVEPYLELLPTSTRC